MTYYKVHGNKRCGIQNNTGICFMNAVLQCMFTWAEFNKRLKTLLPSEVMKMIHSKGTAIFTDESFNRLNFMYYEYIFILYMAMYVDTKEIHEKYVNEFINYLLYFRLKCYSKVRSTFLRTLKAKTDKLKLPSFNLTNNYTSYKRAFRKIVIRGGYYECSTMVSIFREYLRIT